MKENYSAMCENILNNLNDKKKLLLHSCCGPCSSYVISYLTDYFDITILYYNPNIFPYDEYLKRKDEQIRLINDIKSNIKNNIDIMDCDYDNDIYNDLVKGLENEPERGNRCKVCYRMRMEKTAIIAKENNLSKTDFQQWAYQHYRNLQEMHIDCRSLYKCAREDLKANLILES